MEQGGPGRRCRPRGTDPRMPGPARRETLTRARGGGGPNYPFVCRPLLIRSRIQAASTPSW
ncbi:hypothetical protein GCM10027447_01590 [Glycomyces halotolerans]